MIKNGANFNLLQQQGGLPDVSSAMDNWFQFVTFTRVTKTSENFRITETREDINFKGVVQQLRPQDLEIKPEGQRTWNWLQVHALPALILNTDEVIEYQEKNYRVMNKIDHSKYGYVEYHIVEDYVNAA